MHVPIVAHSLFVGVTQNPPNPFFGDSALNKHISGMGGEFEFGHGAAHILHQSTNYPNHPLAKNILLLAHLFVRGFLEVNVDD
jgi:hypothetical protein